MGIVKGIMLSEKKIEGLEIQVRVCCHLVSYNYLSSNLCIFRRKHSGFDSVWESFRSGFTIILFQDYIWNY